MRRTKSLIAVLKVVVDDPTSRHWGYDLQKRAGIRSGVLYPMLRRLTEAEWLEDGWEDPAETEGRPPRRYYRLTDEGLVRARTMLAGNSSPATDRLRLEGGVA